MSLLEAPTGSRDLESSQIKEQYLFLLEFFVHRVTSERLAKLNRMFFVPTRVCLKFLDFDEDDMAVTPVDLLFEPKAGATAEQIENFNSGLSVIFAIASYTIVNESMEFKIKLSVEKKMPETIKPDVLVGTGEIDMTKHFAALRKEMLQCVHTNYPPPKIFEGDVDLIYQDKYIGSVAIYVRISGFGQSIETEISTEAQKKSSSYVFRSIKNEDEQLAYKCRMISPSTTDVCNETNDAKIVDPCQVCQPTKYPCTPCGLANGAGGKSQDLESVLRGKPLAVPWEPKDSGDVPIIREFHENTAHYAADLPIQSSRGPTGPCGNAVVLKVSGLLDVDDPSGQRKQPTVTIGADSSEPDPEHDVFILRIGKKGLVGADEKSDIQLEMRTPKGPERRPPIRYETREMQTEEEVTAKATKPGKAKGKGKKNKKKK